MTFHWHNKFQGYVQCTNEFLASRLFRLLLGHQTPITKLGKDKVEVKNSYFITSKIIDNVEQLKLFDKSKLNKVQGFEKMIAACFIMGDHDYKDQNLLVQTLSNNSYQMIKVDHGISFKNFI